MNSIIIKRLLSKGSKRTAEAKKNIVLSAGLKAISIFVTLQLVPLTIDFLNPSLYGIWLTLSSIVSWAQYFDLGFGNGFRNKFTEARAKEDDELCKQYLSTTYFILGVIFSTVYAIVYISSNYINWSGLLNVDPALNDILRKTFVIIAGFFCLNFVVNIISTLMTACQKPAYASLLNTIGQITALIAIFILVHNTEGALDKLAFALSGIPCFVLIINTFFIYNFTRYKKYRPSFKNIKISLCRNIISLGGKFFVITICYLLIFQLINIILTRLCGPEAVAEYNVSHRYFNLVHMVVAIIIAPFWSAYTDAYTCRDTKWMQSTLKKLEKMIILVAFGLVFLVIISPIFYHYWIGDKITIHTSVSISTAIYVFCSTCGLIYMHIINGIGKIKLQLLTYVIFAIVSLPVLYFSCKEWGIVGILITPSIVLFTQAVLMRFQLYKLINGNAQGIWNE